MRHGPAEDRAASGRDFDRALTREGRIVVERAAQRFHASRTEGARLRVLVSPFRRAIETAQIVAAHAKTPVPPELEQVDELAADAEALPLALVESLAAGSVEAVLVAHQPMVEALVHKLAAVALPAGFRTAMIVSFTREDRAWHLAHVLDAHE